MTEDNILPRWSVRLDAHRPENEHGFVDLVPLVAHHYQMYAKAVEFLGPYNSKQRARGAYLPPSVEALKAAIPRGRVNDFTYLAFINSLVRFCERHKGLRALPTPHPSVIHSIQLPVPSFELQDNKGSTIVKITGVDVPIVVKGLRGPNEIRFIIVRPKLSSLGTASASKWEVLFFRENLGYIPDWADTQLNPRYAGVIG